MTAAILQGAPGTTLNKDRWIDLPERQYIRLLTFCQKLGATILKNTVVALRDGSLINFLYRVDGLERFATEAKKAIEIDHNGVKLKVLHLEQIIRSKACVGRPKDLAVLPLLRQTLKSQRELAEEG